MNDSPPTAGPAQPLEEAQPLQDSQPQEAALDAEGSWLEHAEELPARPRRRILAPLPVALLLALAVACGFIAGVLVQKGQAGPSGTGELAGLRNAAAFGGAGGAGALRRGGAGGSGAATQGSSSTPGSGSSPGAGAGAGGAGAGNATIGQVAYVSHGTLYVTTAEGNTVKVTAPAGAKVTKTVETHVGGIHPGETVVVSGTPNANGSISAQTIRAVGAGGFGGLGGGGLFGSGASGSVSPPAGGGSGGSSSGSKGGPSTGGGQALFGKE